MTRDKKEGFQQAAKDIDISIGDLLGTLGQAVSEIVDRLGEGHSGEVSREQVFETEKGPVRAQAGVRLRVGGLDAPSKRVETPKPVNPQRGRAASKTTPEIRPRDLVFDLIEDADQWILTADMPGVSVDDLSLEKQDLSISITTTGTRKYAAVIEIGTEFDISRARVSLRNGILDVKVPKVPAP